MRLSSPALAMEARGAVDISLVEVLLEQQRLLLEREEELRGQMESKMDKMQKQAEANLDKLRAELTPAPPAEAISGHQIAALHARLEALHEQQVRVQLIGYARSNM